MATPVALSRRDVTVQRPQRFFLTGGQRTHGRDQEVAVALEVTRAQRERPLQVAADEVVAEDLQPPLDEGGEHGVELGIGGHGHRLRVGPGMIGA